MSDMPGRDDEGAFVLAVASGKGGVGKTTTTVNLGAALAADGYDVAVVDVDLGMANLAGLVGVDPQATLHDVLAGKAPLKAACYDAYGTTVVPGSTVLEAFADADARRLERVVRDLERDHQVVLLDAGAGLSHDIAAAIDAADGVLLVATAELSSLTDAGKTGRLVEKLEKPVVGAVFTRTGGGAFDDVEGIAAALGTTNAVTASIPRDENVRRSIRRGVPVVDLEPDTPASRAYRRLGDRLTDLVGIDPARTANHGFEWVDAETGERRTDPGAPTETYVEEDGTTIEISLDELIEEAGLENTEEAAQARVTLIDRVRAKFD